MAKMIILLIFMVQITQIYSACNNRGFVQFKSLNLPEKNSPDRLRLSSDGTTLSIVGGNSVEEQIFIYRSDVGSKKWRTPQILNISSKTNEVFLTKYADSLYVTEGNKIIQYSYQINSQSYIYDSTIDWNFTSINGFSVSKDKQILAVGTQQGLIIVINLVNSTQITVINDTKYQIQYVDFSNTKIMVASSKDHIVRVYNYSTGQFRNIQNLTDSKDYVSSTDISLNGEMIVTGSSRYAYVYQYDNTQYKFINKLDTGGSILEIQLSNNLKTIAVQKSLQVLIYQRTQNSIFFETSNPQKIPSETVSISDIALEVVSIESAQAQLVIANFLGDIDIYVQIQCQLDQCFQDGLCTSNPIPVWLIVIIISAIVIVIVIVIVIIYRCRRKKDKDQLLITNSGYSLNSDEILNSSLNNMSQQKSKKKNISTKSQINLRRK